DAGLVVSEQGDAMPGRVSPVEAEAVAAGSRVRASRLGRPGSAERVKSHPHRRKGDSLPENSRVTTSQKCQESSIDDALQKPKGLAMQTIAVYVRVSTHKQDTKSQEPDLQQWTSAFANGSPVIWYRDKATGKTMDRPDWRRLDADMRAGKIGALVCWRLDRRG